MILVYRIGDGAEQRRPVAGDRVTIGRAPSCDVVVDEVGVEAEHCRLVRRDAQWHVEDNRTRSGTVVLRGGGAFVQLVLAGGRALADGDHVLIGHETRPRFRAWITAPPAVPASTAGSGEADAPPAPDPPAASAGPAAPERTFAPTPRVAMELAALRAETKVLRAKLADALRGRDADAADRDHARDEMIRIEALWRDEHARELEALSDQVTTRDVKLAALARHLAAEEQARVEAEAALRDERGQRERALQITAQAVAEANASGLLAQQRAVVIEEMSGHLAVLAAKVAERDHLVANLEAENARLHRIYDR